MSQQSISWWENVLHNIENVILVLGQLRYRNMKIKIFWWSDDINLIKDNNPINMLRPYITSMDLLIFVEAEI